MLRAVETVAIVITVQLKQTRVDLSSSQNFSGGSPHSLNLSMVFSSLLIGSEHS